MPAKIRVDLATYLSQRSLFDPRTGCLVWTRALSVGRPGDGGYGVFVYHQRRYYAHRAAWELVHGPIPEGRCIDHLCRNRSCVDPHHMELTTNRVNILRGVGPSARNARKTHCDHGHALDEENTYWRHDGGGRQCKTCGKIRAIGYAQQHKEGQSLGA